MVHEWLGFWKWAFLEYHSNDLWALGSWYGGFQKGHCPAYSLSASQSTPPFLLHHSPDQGTWSNQRVLTSSLPSFLPSTWHLYHVRNRYWFANVKQLGLWVWQLVVTGLRSDLNPCGGTSLVHVIEKLRVTQSSITCNFPRNTEEWWRDGCQPHFIIYFCYRMGFSKVTYIKRPSHSVAWVTIFGWADTPLVPVTPLPNEWHLLQPGSLCLPRLPGSPAVLPAWLLATVTADIE